MKTKITLNTAGSAVKEYLLMTVGILFYTFAWIGCILPAHGTGGGATGLSLVITSAVRELTGFEIGIGTMVLAINAILLLIGGMVVGWKFGIKTIFCIVLMSISMNYLQAYLPDALEWLKAHEVISAGSTSIFGNLEPLLLVIMGGMLMGLGIFICLRQGGSTGGVDILAVVLNKYRPVNYGRIVMAHDTTVILASLLVGNGLETVIYGFVATAVFSFTTDALLSGSQQSTQLLIMSQQFEAIAEQITVRAHRGVTMLDGMGWFTKEPSQVVMVICRKRETADILKIVKAIDPNAFVSVASVTGVYGKGFGIIGSGMLAGASKK